MINARPEHYGAVPVIIPPVDVAPWSGIVQQSQTLFAAGARPDFNNVVPEGRTFVAAGRHFVFPRPQSECCGSGVVAGRVAASRAINGFCDAVNCDGDITASQVIFDVKHEITQIVLCLFA